MNIMIFTNLKFLWFVTSFIPVGYCLNDTNGTDDARKRYGYGFYGSCSDYEKVFECLTKCQSLDYQVYRLDHKCKCSCQEMRSTLVLPYFKWLTTGTPKTLPTTRSPRLYDVAGTLSPNPFTSTIPPDNNTCPTFPSVIQNNYTKVLLPNNTTEVISNQTESETTEISNQTESVGTETSTPAESNDTGTSKPEENGTTLSNTTENTTSTSEKT